MKKYDIKFNDFAEIQKFAQVISQYDSHADLRCGSILIDAKSLMGLLAFGAGKSAELILHGGSDEQI